MVVKDKRDPLLDLRERRLRIIWARKGRSGRAGDPPSMNQGVVQKIIAQLLIVPVSVVASSTAFNLHTPDAGVPTNEANDVSGWKQPLKGAALPATGVAQVESRTVFVKLSNESPLSEQMSRFAPVGEMSVRSKSASQVCVML
jgi:hypothetical protein